MCIEMQVTSKPPLSVNGNVESFLYGSQFTPMLFHVSFTNCPLTFNDHTSWPVLTTATKSIPSWYNANQDTLSCCPYHNLHLKKIILFTTFCQTYLQIIKISTNYTFRIIPVLKMYFFACDLKMFNTSSEYEIFSQIENAIPFSQFFGCWTQISLGFLNPDWMMHYKANTSLQNLF